MNDNIVCLNQKRNEIKVEPNEEDKADSFISYFFDWAQEQGIDTSSVEFKFNAATVLTVIQSLLHERN